MEIFIAGQICLKLHRILPLALGGFRKLYWALNQKQSILNHMANFKWHKQHY